MVPRSAPPTPELRVHDGTLMSVGPAGPEPASTGGGEGVLRLTLPHWGNSTSPEERAREQRSEEGSRKAPPVAVRWGRTKESPRAEVELTLPDRT